jgi:hypothetical protein
MSLVAVTARTNRSNADQDPAEWPPPASDQCCRYIGEWIGTKLRWGLAIDKAKLEALKAFPPDSRGRHRQTCHRRPGGRSGQWR